MKLVIEIPDGIYNSILKGDCGLGVVTQTYISIKQGTPLPKGHGDLKDVGTIYDKLMRSYNADMKDYPILGKNYRVGLSQAVDLLNLAPTIIEADREEEK